MMRILPPGTQARLGTTERLQLQRQTKDAFIHIPHLHPTKVSTCKNLKHNIYNRLYAMPSEHMPGPSQK